MLVVLKENLVHKEVEYVLSELKKMGMPVRVVQEKPVITIHILSHKEFVAIEAIEQITGVQHVILTSKPYRLTTRQYQKEDTVIQIGDLRFGGGHPIMIAGPCAVESETQMLEIAQIVSRAGVKLLRGGAFKPRTSPYSFSGLGEKGLKLLREAGDETGVLIVTEVIDTADVSLVAEYADILQIGSRNMQNYQLLRAVGKCKRPVLLKRGMSARLDEFLMSAEYIMAEGNPNVILCERGIRSFVEYSRNTLDLNVVPALKEVSHLPVIVDPSHGTGKRNYIEPMAMAAVAAGADGIMVEVHPHPDESWSDAAQALHPEQFNQMIRKLTDLIEWQKSYAQTNTPY